MPKKKKVVEPDDEENAFVLEAEEDEGDELEEAGFHLADLDEGSTSTSGPKKGLAIDKEQDYESGSKGAEKRSFKRKGSGLLDDYEEHLAAEEAEDREPDEDDEQADEEDDDFEDEDDAFEAEEDEEDEN